MHYNEYNGKCVYIFNKKEVSKTWKELKKVAGTIIYVVIHAMNS